MEEGNSVKTSDTMFFGRIRNLYERYERPVSSMSLVFGFIIDALTLKRADRLWENLWVGILLLIVAVCIILINRSENKAKKDVGEVRSHFWYVNTLQFGFGGVLSAFLVLYFRSSTLLVSWPFLLILFGAFLSNEIFKKHYIRLIFQISFFFLALFLFAIFLIPLIVHKIGPEIFLLSGAVAILVLGLFLKVLKRFSFEGFIYGKKYLLASIAGIFLVVNIFYFLNIIPPIPLSLRDAGIYHSLTKTPTGDYVAIGEEKKLSDYFRLYPKFYATVGTTVYAYSAIFSPASINTGIVHEWESYDQTKKEWTRIGRVELGVVGGRAGGYRTYSIKEEIAPGKWRVNVLTPRGQVIGRLQFEVVYTDTLPLLKTIIKN